MKHQLPGKYISSPLAVAIALSFTAFSGSAFANAVPIDKEIEHITVEGNDIQTLAGHTAVLNKADIERKGAANPDTASLLRGLSGVHLNAAGGLSSLPVIRGLGDDRLRIKVNGMDLIASCPNHMNPPLSYLAPSDIGTLTVYAGLSPVSAGGDSLGGSIIAESKLPAFSPIGDSEFSGDFGAFYRTNNQARGINLNLQHTTEATLLSYSGNWSEANNYSAADHFKPPVVTGRPGHTLPLDEVGSSAFETQNHNVRFAWQMDEANMLDAKLNYQDMPLQLYPNQRMDLLDNEQINLNLAWHRDTDWGQITTRFYHEQVEHMMDFGADKQFFYGSNAMMGMPCEPIRFMGDPEGTCAAGMPMYSESLNTGLTLKSDYFLSARDLIRVGVELQRYNLDDYWTPSGGRMGPGTFLNINDGNRNRVAFYLEREHSPFDDWMFLYGARYENVAMDTGRVQGYAMTVMAPGMQLNQANAFNQGSRDSTDHNIDVTMVARYDVSKQLNAEVGYAHKVRSPNLYEKYPWSSWMMAAGMNNLVGDGNGYVGNADLAPEKAHTMSASLHWQNSRQSELSANLYYTHIDDFIDAVAANTMWMPDQFNVLRYENQSARIYGVDINGTWHISHGNTGHWQLDGSFSLIDSENNDTGSGVFQVIPMQSTLRLSHKLNGWHSSLEWQLVAQKDEVSVIRNEVATAGYGLLNLQVSHNWENIRVDAGVDNLLDKFYFNPTGGSYTGQGMTMSLNGIESGIAVPGMGRAFYIATNVSF